ncbi:MAG: hypothetical protein QOJ64_2579 [Acidobacteriota bacterium]|jgi:hypothetical protein|nr:hypothetical protein [Acidobacteriota bacterium]
MNLQEKVGLVLHAQLSPVVDARAGADSRR